MKSVSEKLEIAESILTCGNKEQLSQHFSSVPLQLLTQFKQIVKDQLISYDQDFKAIFSRLPKKSEKQPIKPLYVYYEELKVKITKDTLEKIEALKQEREKLKLELEDDVKEFQAAFGRIFDRVEDKEFVKEKCIIVKNLKYQIIELEQSIKLK